MQLDLALIQPQRTFAGSEINQTPMHITRDRINQEQTALTMRIPDRFRSNRITREQAVKEVCALGQLFMVGAKQLGRCYLRIADTIREFQLTDEEVRTALKDTFPPSRISEILRVANSPDEVYHRWQTGFVGFKAALKECRYYNITPPARLIAKQKRRAAERLVKLATAGERIEVLGHYVSVELAKEIDIKRIAENL